LGLRFLPTFRPYGTLVECIRVFGQTLIICIAGLIGIACVESKEKEQALQNWQFYRGDASLSGYTDLRLPDKPVLLWTFKSEARTSSSPVIYGGTTYWCDKRGKIYGVDANGTQSFTFDLATAVEASPMIFDSILYIGRIDGKMSAISLASADTLWNFETMGQISASPNRTEFGGKTAIVFGSYDNYLYCIDCSSGKQINRYESGYYINGAVALCQQSVVFGGCDAWLRIIDATEGIAGDSLLLDAYVPSSPAISGNCCYIADYSGNVYELILDKGKIAAHKKILTSSDDNANFVSVPAVSPTMLYTVSYDRYLRATERKSGDVKWKYLLKGNTGESSPVVCRNRIIACTKTGIVSIMTADTGELLWEFDAGEQITASPAIIQNRFFILTTKGTLFCFGKE
jgi:outer membrane protein assembly factor BamB